MTLIAVMILVACAGFASGLVMLRQSDRRRVAELIRNVERGAGYWTDTAEETESGALPARVRKLMPATVMASYETRLRQIGRPYGLDAQQFVALKLMGGGLLPVLISLVVLLNLNGVTLLLLPLSALAGFLAPDVWLGIRLAERTRQVAEELALFTDLIATAVSAGLPITEAVRRVAEDAPGLVAREFLRAVQEMAAGKPRLEAWRDLTDRLPGDDLRTIVTAIMQAEQYGTSVAEMLKYQVQQIRLFKQQNAQRIAQSVTVKMRIPMLLLILLPFMVLLLGPALLQIARLLR